MFDALSAIEVGREDPRTATDSDYYFFFLMADGSERWFSFNQRYLVKDGARYEISGDDALWRAEFPGYSRACSMLDVRGDERAAALESEDAGTAPTAVSFRQGDGPVSQATDPKFIRQVAQAMAATHVTWVEDGKYFDPAGETESVFAFAMPDGGELSFTLYGDCLAVDTGVEQLGTQFYTLEDTDPLWSLSFPGYERIRSDKGIELDLLELYGQDVRDALGWENRGRLVSLIVTRSAQGEAEEHSFTQGPYGAVSDMAEKFCGLGYIEEQTAAPEGAELCRFVFTDEEGETYEFIFVDGCAAIEQADGTLRYYPVEHSDIDENGVMDLVYQEQELLEWKEDVNFQGKSPKPVGVGTILRVAAILLVLAGALGGAVYGIIRLARRNKNRDQTDDRQ